MTLRIQRKRRPPCQFCRLLKGLCPPCRRRQLAAQYAEAAQDEGQLVAIASMTPWLTWNHGRPFALEAARLFWLDCAAFALREKFREAQA